MLSSVLTQSGRQLPSTTAHSALDPFSDCVLIEGKPQPAWSTRSRRVATALLSMSRPMSASSFAAGVELRVQVRDRGDPVGDRHCGYLPDLAASGSGDSSPNQAQIA
jgi:hypothetical protein